MMICEEGFHQSDLVMISITFINETNNKRFVSIENDN